MASLRALVLVRSFRPPRQLERRAGNVGSFDLQRSEGFAFMRAQFVAGQHFVQRLPVAVAFSEQRGRGGELFSVVLALKNDFSAIRHDKPKGMRGFLGDSRCSRHGLRVRLWCRVGLGLG